jgi:RNA polymerase sigma factor for flagellar operon FliA
MEPESDRLIQYLPWARHFARACSSRLPSHLDHDDLQAAGVLGYLRAASRYDLGRGASFRGYCAARIRGAVLDEVRRWDWAPRSVHQSHRRITRVTTHLSERLEREPTHCEIASALGVDAAELAAMQAHSQPRQMVSFDEVLENPSGEETLGLAERLADANAAQPDARVKSQEDRRALVRCIHRLPKTQATVIVLHYLQEVPLRDVAHLLDVTPSRVSQLHHQALGRIRQAWATAERAA